MLLFDIDWHPNDKRLQRFGFACSAFAVIATGAAIFRAHDPKSALAVMRSARVILLLFVGAIAVVVGFVRPRLLAPVYIGLTLVTAPIGWCVSYATITIVYIAVFTPLALVFRLTGRDVLRRRFNKGAKTYWVARKQSPYPRSYFREF
jgi:hypothetical protein